MNPSHVAAAEREALKGKRSPTGFLLLAPSSPSAASADPLYRNFMPIGEAARETGLSVDCLKKEAAVVHEGGTWISRSRIEAMRRSSRGSAEIRQDVDSSGTATPEPTGRHLSEGAHGNAPIRDGLGIQEEPKLAEETLPPPPALKSPQVSLAVCPPELSHPKEESGAVSRVVQEAKTRPHQLAGSQRSRTSTLKSSLQPSIELSQFLPCLGGDWSRLAPRFGASGDTSPTLRRSLSDLIKITEREFGERLEGVLRELFRRKLLPAQDKVEENSRMILAKARVANATAIEVIGQLKYLDGKNGAVPDITLKARAFLVELDIKALERQRIEGRQIALKNGLLLERKVLQDVLIRRLLATRR